MELPFPVRLRTLTVLAAAAGVTASAQAQPATRLDVDPRPFIEVGGDGTGADPLLESVLSATRTAQGLVVGESRTGVLLFLDAKGKLVRTAGRPGQGPGEFMGGIFVRQCSGDSLFTWDSRTQRIAVFSASGTYVRQVPALGTQFACSRAGSMAILLRPSAAAAQGRGTTAGLFASIKLINAAGDSVGTVASVPFGENRLFGAATSIAMRGNELYVGTGREPAIDVYDQRGNAVRRIAFPHVPVRVTPAAQIRAVDGLLSAMKAAGALQDPERQRAALLARPVPEEFPPYREVAVAPNGLVWLLTSQMIDTVAHLKAVRADGTIATDVDLPIGDTARLLEAGDDYLLLTSVTSDGVMRVGAFRVRPRPR